MIRRAICVASCVCSISACRSASEPAARSVEHAWSGGNSRLVTQPESVAGPPVHSAEVIATVNGRPISARSLIDPLLAGRGVELLEQLIVLTAAKDAALEAGLSVSEGDVRAEFRRSLDALAGDVSASEDVAVREHAAESVLNDVLAGRNLSRAEYMVAIRRNAYLRKLAERDVQVDEGRIKAEFDRLFGDRVEIRHIQCPSEVDVMLVVRRLEEGADFEDLTARYSSNSETARKGGLLPPFSRDDPEIPGRLRDAAFALEPGQVSRPMLVDGWHHIIRVERYIPAEAVEFEDTRIECEQSLLSRLTEAAMQRLAVDLFNDARLEITDPILREMFNNKHGVRTPNR